MIKNKYEKKIITKNRKKIISYSITCNKCGFNSIVDVKNYNDKDKTYIVDENTKFYETSISFGYGSRFDLENWDIYLCNKCYEKFYSSLNVKPEKK